MRLISKIMTCGAMRVSSGAPLAQALQKMDEWTIRATPVCDDSKLVGMLSSQDVAGSDKASDASLRRATVADYMRRDLVYCFDDRRVGDALLQMSNRHVRHLPIVNRTRALIGIVSLADVGNRPAERAGTGTFARIRPRTAVSTKMRTHRPASGSADGKF